MLFIKMQVDFYLYGDTNAFYQDAYVNFNVIMEMLFSKDASANFNVMMMQMFSTKMHMQILML